VRFVFAILLAVALAVAVVLLLADTSWAATDWKAQAQKNYHHAVVHSHLVGGGHVIEPREEAGYYNEAVRLNRYVQKTWRKIAHPKVVSAASWRPCVRHFWPASAVPHALYIIRRESGGQETVPNHQGSGCIGLFQLCADVYQGRISGIAAFDPTVGWMNVRAAAKLYRICGWSPWAVN